MTALLDRLKERKLVQWALAYLAGVWLLLQVVHLLGEQFEWPLAVLRSITLLLGVGFFAAVVLAWYHGEKGAQRVSGPELLMLGALLVIAGGVVWLVGRDSAGAGADAAQLRSLESGQLALASAAPAQRSIAVLPFANLSRDPENEYFSDGITDEILTTLANVGDLRVISRTSVMQYKGTTKSLRQIAQELRVAHVLEGSVQRAGERVRIHVQLIDAQTDAHLWAERYDRPLEDIFAVQSEIAQRIAQALQAELTPGERARLARQPTENLTAYEYVLRGRELVRRPSPRDIEAGLSLLRRTRELDPTYADAYAALAEAFLNQYFLHGDRMWLDSQTVSAQRAIALDPEFAPGYLWLGWALDWRGERDAALEAQLRAVELNPNVSGGLANLYHYSFGRLDEAARWWRPALEGDPTNSAFYWLAGRTYLNLGMTARARQFLEKAVEFQPDLAWSYYNLSTTFLLEGRPDAARAQIQRMLTASGNHPDALLFAGHSALAMGDLPAARRYFEQGLPAASSLEKAWGTLALAWVLQQSGESERARELTREAARQLERRWGGSPNRLEDYADLARIRVLEGDREGALQAFKEGVRRGWRFYNDRPGDPILGSMQGDPRFDRLMAEVKADVDRMRARVEREGW